MTDRQPDPGWPELVFGLADVRFSDWPAAG
jgi:hypothetical protein